MAQEPIRITASEFRQNFGTYMRNVANFDYEVTRNGQVIGLWTDPNRNRREAAERLIGMNLNLADDLDVEKLIEERRLRRGGYLPRYPEDDPS